MNELEVMRFDTATMQRVLHEQPTFSELFMAHLLARNTRVKLTWSSNYSIRVRNVWRDCCC
jgi:hypothetical protein